VQLWPLALRQSLPIVPVPLKENREAQLDLRKTLDHVYDAAGYADYVYQLAPQPALLPADDAWAATLAGGR
jgi:hypothetical protein